MKKSTVTVHLEGGTTIDVKPEQLLALRAFDLVTFDRLRSRVFTGHIGINKAMIEAFLRESGL
jgi:hypothetical protein